jgi:hypothetical protein
MNRRNIIVVVKVTIYSSIPQCKTFYKIIIVAQEVMEITNSPTFCPKSNNKGSFSEDLYGGIFIRSALDKIVAMFFPPKPPVDLSGPPGEPLRTTGGLCGPYCD